MCGKQIADLRAASPAGGEFPLRRLEEHVEFAELPLEVIDSERLAGVGEQVWLWIEGVDVRDAARHVDEDHILGPGRERG